MKGLYGYVFLFCIMSLISLQAFEQPAETDSIFQDINDFAANIEEAEPTKKNIDYFQELVEELRTEETTPPQCMRELDLVFSDFQDRYNNRMHILRTFIENNKDKIADLKVFREQFPDAADILVAQNLSDAARNAFERLFPKLEEKKEEPTIPEIPAEPEIVPLPTVPEKTEEEEEEEEEVISEKEPEVVPPPIIPEERKEEKEEEVIPELIPTPKITVVPEKESEIVPEPIIFEGPEEEIEEEPLKPIGVPKIITPIEGPIGARPKLLTGQEVQELIELIINELNTFVENKKLNTLHERVYNAASQKKIELSLKRDIDAILQEAQPLFISIRGILDELYPTIVSPNAALQNTLNKTLSYVLVMFDALFAGVYDVRATSLAEKAQTGLLGFLGFGETEKQKQQRENKRLQRIKSTLEDIGYPITFIIGLFEFYLIPHMATKEQFANHLFNAMVYSGIKKITITKQPTGTRAPIQEKVYPYLREGKVEGRDATFVQQFHKKITDYFKIVDIYLAKLREEFEKAGIAFEEKQMIKPSYVELEQKEETEKEEKEFEEEIKLLQEYIAAAQRKEAESIVEPKVPVAPIVEPKKEPEVVPPPIVPEEPKEKVEEEEEEEEEIPVIEEESEEEIEEAPREEAIEEEAAIPGIPEAPKPQEPLIIEEIPAIQELPTEEELEKVETLRQAYTAMNQVIARIQERTQQLRTAQQQNEETKYRLVFSEDELNSIFDTLDNLIVLETDLEQRIRITEQLINAFSPYVNQLITMAFLSESINEQTLPTLHAYIHQNPFNISEATAFLEQLMESEGYKHVQTTIETVSNTIASFSSLDTVMVWLTALFDAYASGMMTPTILQQQQSENIINDFESALTDGDAFIGLLNSLFDQWSGYATPSTQTAFQESTLDITTLEPSLLSNDTYIYAIQPDTPLPIDTTPLKTVEINAFHKKAYDAIISSLLNQLKAQETAEAARALLDSQNYTADTLAQQLEDLEAAKDALPADVYEQLKKELEEKQTSLSKVQNQLDQFFNAFKKQLEVAHKKLADTPLNITQLNIGSLYRRIQTILENNPQLKPQYTPQLEDMVTSYEHYITAALNTMVNQTGLKELHFNVQGKTAAARQTIYKSIPEPILEKIANMLNQLKQHKLFGVDSTADYKNPPTKALQEALIRGYAYILVAYDALEATLYENFSITERMEQWAYFLFTTSEKGTVTLYDKAIQTIEQIITALNEMRELYYKYLIDPFFEGAGSYKDAYEKEQLDLMLLGLENITGENGEYLYKHTELIDIYKGQRISLPAITSMHKRNYEEIPNYWKNILARVYKDELLVQTQKNLITTIQNTQLQHMQPTGIQMKDLIDTFKDDPVAIITFMQNQKKTYDAINEELKKLAAKNNITEDIRVTLEHTFELLLGSYDAFAAYIYDLIKEHNLKETKTIDKQNIKQTILTAFRTIAPVIVENILLFHSLFSPHFTPKFNQQYEQKQLLIGGDIDALNAEGLYIFERPIGYTLNKPTIATQQEINAYNQKSYATLRIVDKEKKMFVPPQHKKEYRAFLEGWEPILQAIEHPIAAEVIELVKEEKPTPTPVTVPTQTQIPTAQPTQPIQTPAAQPSITLPVQSPIQPEQPTPSGEPTAQPIPKQPEVIPATPPTPTEQPAQPPAELPTAEPPITPPAPTQPQLTQQAQTVAHILLKQKYEGATLQDLPDLINTNNFDKVLASLTNMSKGMNFGSIATILENAGKPLPYEFRAILHETAQAFIDSYNAIKPKIGPGVADVKAALVVVIQLFLSEINEYLETIDLQALRSIWEEPFIEEKEIPVKEKEEEEEKEQLLEQPVTIISPPDVPKILTEQEIQERIDRIINELNTFIEKHKLDTLHARVYNAASQNKIELSLKQDLNAIFEEAQPLFISIRSILDELYPTIVSPNAALQNMLNKTLSYVLVMFDALFAGVYDVRATPLAEKAQTGIWGVLGYRETEKQKQQRENKRLQRIKSTLEDIGYPIALIISLFEFYLIPHMATKEEFANHLFDAMDYSGIKKTIIIEERTTTKPGIEKKEYPYLRKGKVGGRDATFVQALHKKKTDYFKIIDTYLEQLYTIFEKAGIAFEKKQVTKPSYVVLKKVQSSLKEEIRDLQNILTLNLENILNQYEMPKLVQNKDISSLPIIPKQKKDQEIETSNLDIVYKPKPLSQSQTALITTIQNTQLQHMQPTGIQMKDLIDAFRDDPSMIITFMQNQKNIYNAINEELTKLTQENGITEDIRVTLEHTFELLLGSYDAFAAYIFDLIIEYNNQPKREDRQPIKQAILTTFRTIAPVIVENISLFYSLFSSYFTPAFKQQYEQRKLFIGDDIDATVSFDGRTLYIFERPQGYSYNYPRQGILNDEQYKQVIREYNTDNYATLVLTPKAKVRMLVNPYHQKLYEDFLKGWQPILQEIERPTPAEVIELTPTTLPTQTPSPTAQPAQTPQPPATPPTIPTPQVQPSIQPPFTPPIVSPASTPPKTPTAPATTPGTPPTTPAGQQPTPPATQPSTTQPGKGPVQPGQPTPTGSPATQPTPKQPTGAPATPPTKSPTTSPTGQPTPATQPSTTQPGQTPAQPGQPAQPPVQPPVTPATTPPTAPPTGQQPTPSTVPPTTTQPPVTPPPPPAQPHLTPQAQTVAQILLKQRYEDATLQDLPDLINTNNFDKVLASLTNMSKGMNFGSVATILKSAGKPLPYEFRAILHETAQAFIDSYNAIKPKIEPGVTDVKEALVVVIQLFLSEINKYLEKTDLETLRTIWNELQG